MRRSAKIRPPDWQVGQYWNDRVASDTSRTVSPQTGHASPVLPWTRIDCRLPSFSAAGSVSTASATASLRISRIAADSRSDLVAGERVRVPQR